MHVNIRFESALLAIFLTLMAGRPGDCQKITWTGELYRSEDVRNRVEAEGEGLDVLIVDVRSYERVKYHAAGIQTRWLTVGPLGIKGLLREIYNPLGYGPGSAVFKESTGAALDGSFTGGSRTGIVLGVIPRCLSGFLIDSRETLKAGGSLNVALGEFWRTELLLSVSEPARELATSAWFVERPVFPGGRLINGSARLALDREPIFLSLSGGFSAGKWVRNGHFSHLDLCVGPDSVNAEIFIGIASRDYFNPDGGWSKKAVRTGFELRLLPFEFLSLKAAYIYDLYHLPGRTVALGASSVGPLLSTAFAGKEVLEAESRLEWAWDRKSSIALSPALRLARERSAKGGNRVETLIGLPFYLVLPWLSAALEYRLRDGESDLDLEFRYAYAPEWMTLRISADRLLPLADPVALTVEVQARFYPQRFWVRFDFFPGDERLDRRFLISAGCKLQVAENSVESSYTRGQE